MATNVTNVAIAVPTSQLFEQKSGPLLMPNSTCYLSTVRLKNVKTNRIFESGTEQVWPRGTVLLKTTYYQYNPNYS